MMTQILQFFTTIWSLVVILVVVAGLLLPSVLLTFYLPLTTRLKIIGPIWRIISFSILKFGIFSKISFIDRRKIKKSGLGLYIANHQSFIDIPLIAMTTPIPPIMKKEVLYVPLFGLLGYGSGALTFSRKELNSRRKVLTKVINRLTKEKFSVQYYPEGSRSKDGIIKDITCIKTSLMSIAYRNKINVYPMSLYGTHNILNKFGIVKPGISIGIIHHEKIEPSLYGSEDEFITACWNKVIEGNAELKDICLKNL
jgi:1-acyl-sn-glycerol-3-phosphate acyltransferase